ncbi:LysR family transcriptional regulator [Lichenihabitans sp. Uapishka_5]|uniref:LysR family transcriptional regulator n=1 Tax=Lichenihabitans sp. Uapishka_5 TaxID=3037302 RepID=UPI0029E7F1B5|nr:LysR family transcriptional regulator [Lichenihabitans sp. Uapishka_5]MDX7953716.1 LysR family transcriptional regulator [Lichenihabitans sp. Uapishka_5]
MIGSLTLDQLRVLVAVADAGSFSAAGRKLGRVQSAVSQAVQTLEDAQGVQVFDRSGHKPRFTPVGASLLEQARHVLSSVGRFEAVAAGARIGLEPALNVAIDPFVPTAPLIDSLHALRGAFPDLPVNFWTEGIGGAERRLGDGSASLGVCLLVPAPPPSLTAYGLMDLRLVAVATPGHPLVQLGRPLHRVDLEAQTQLVLSYPNDQDGTAFGIVGSRLWRFVDLGRRLDFLLAGLGWCKVPHHLVAPHIAAGRLVELVIPDESIMQSASLRIYAAHGRDRPLGRAGGWLLADLRTRLRTAPTPTQPD